MIQSGKKRPVVLIVEDEFLIRVDSMDMIRNAGFQVVEARNADEAIRILEDRLDITVVFTDVQMPGSMDGLKLAAAIRSRCRRSKSWLRRDFSTSAKKIYRLALASYPSHTIPRRLSELFEI